MNGTEFSGKMQNIRIRPPRTEMRDGDRPACIPKGRYIVAHERGPFQDRRGNRGLDQAPAGGSERTDFEVSDVTTATVLQLALKTVPTDAVAGGDGKPLRGMARFTGDQQAVPPG